MELPELVEGTELRLAEAGDGLHLSWPGAIVAAPGGLAAGSISRAFVIMSRARGPAAEAPCSPCSTTTEIA